jgi:hypothetical protein
VFSPSDRFTRSPDVVLRRFPEWRQCYAYTPAHPDIYELNTTAWLIVDLCEGQPLTELERDFGEVVRRKASADQGRELLHHGLRDLVDHGILVHRGQVPGGAS